ncbi:unnamed protein product [Polarella glacialis]|uniref:RING-type domain-containing protein n=1 Tax=Polarella glacialis TaxID=89957 RepID=A0A813LKB7_POLGL|nr:unnamed protein product [Polarella glacialis]
MSSADQDFEECPLSGLGRDDFPAWPTSGEAECQVCFEHSALPRICAACPDGRGCCSKCIRTYFTTAVNDALYAMPMIRCPLCRGRVSTAAWAPFVGPEIQAKYLGNAFALLALRCPDCDETASFFVQPTGGSSPESHTSCSFSSNSVLARARSRAAALRSQLEREELWCDLLTARESTARRQRRTAEQDHNILEARTRAAASTLVEAWRRFRSSEASADEFVAKLHCAWPPGSCGLPRSGLCRAARRRAPLCIEDPERRLAMQLAWLRRYPKVRTTCCRASVCFKCKVRGWHRNLSCEERQRQETGRDAQFCPNCQVPTIWSDGCNHIRCVCGTEWTWEDRSGAGGGEGDNVVDDEDDDSDGSGSTNGWMPSEPPRSRTALELAASNPGAKGSDGSTAAEVLKLLATAQRRRRLPPPPSPSPSPPEFPRRRHARILGRDPWLPPTAPDSGRAGDAQVGCLDGHALEPWDDNRFNWVCDGCEARSSSRPAMSRFRCQDCDFDLCSSCFHKKRLESAVDAVESGATAADDGALVAKAADGRAEEHEDGEAEPRSPQRSSQSDLPSVRGQAFQSSLAAVQSARRRKRAKDVREEHKDEEDEVPPTYSTSGGSSSSSNNGNASRNTKNQQTSSSYNASTDNNTSNLAESTPAARAVGSSDSKINNSRHVHIPSVNGAGSGTDTHDVPSSSSNRSNTNEIHRNTSRKQSTRSRKTRSNSSSSSASDADGDHLESELTSSPKSEEQPQSSGVASASVPATSMPLHLAVRSRNALSVRTLLECGAVPSEATFRELSKLPDEGVRKRLEDELRPHIGKVGQTPMTLWAKLQFGMASEELSWMDSAVNSSVLLALRRERDPDVRERFSAALRLQLGDEWFEALQKGAATEELVLELRDAAFHRRRPDGELVRSLLGAGADMHGRIQSSAGHPGSRGQHDHMDSDLEDDWQSESDDSSSADRQENASTSNYWCPTPKSAISCADLVAMQDSCDEDMLSWVLGTEAATPKELELVLNDVSKWRRERLLVIAVGSRNLLMAKKLLAAWSDSPLPSAFWRAFFSVSDSSIRDELEDALREFLAARGLNLVEVPLWALIQLGRASSDKQKDDDVPDVPWEEEPDISVKMSCDACEKLEALLAVEDELSTDDAMPVPFKVFSALRRCRGADARQRFEELLECKLGKSVFLRQRYRAATQELLWELRRALAERRSPDLAFAAQLLRSGANPRAREVTSNQFDDDESGGEDGPWGPLGARYQSEDGLPRTTLELLALNRFAPPDCVITAIAKAVECKADPNRGPYEKPLTLAVRARHVTAIKALLEAGAQLDRQALSGLQTVSNTEMRHEIEDQFMDIFQRGASSLTMKDVGLWAAVQCGFTTVATREIKDATGQPIDVKVLMALRRCRDDTCKQAVLEALHSRFGRHLLDHLQAEAATAELLMELKEALMDERDPDKELVLDLLALGADTQARAELEESDVETAQNTESSGTGSSSSGDGPESDGEAPRPPRRRRRRWAGRA